MKPIAFRATCWLAVMASVGAAAEIYVDIDSTCSSACGGSWATAYPSLQSGIDEAFDAGGGEVWVAAGSYGGVVVLKDQVKVYGGFAGTETLASQSDPFANLTYITGGTNSRAITGAGLSTATTLRGFRIIDGDSGGDYEPGAGMLLTNCSLAVVNCVIQDNVATMLGGGVDIFGGAPTFVNCRFINNDGNLTSGAAAVREDATPTFVNCLFTGNTGMEGAAVGNFRGAPTFLNCTFAKNNAPGDGSRGGALTDYPRTSVFKNCIVFENTATWTTTKSFYISPSGTGSITATNSDIELEGVGEVWDGTGNVNDAPLFVDSAAGNFRVLVSSPCEDAGNNADLPADTFDLDWDDDLLETIPIDLGGAPRIQGTTVDMGAYEGLRTDVADADSSNPDTGDGSMVRFISLEPVNAGDMTALRVTLTNLPSPFTSYNGTTMWVAAPATICHNQSQASPPCSNPKGGFKASRLSCTPHYMDWSTISTLYIYDDEIVPGTTYDVQAIDQGWDTGHEENYSASLTINTSAWGDVTGGFDSGTGTWTPPDGSVDMSTDYTAVLDKFSGVSTAPLKARCDLDADVPTRVIDVADIVSVLNAFSAVPYPFDGPGGCP